MERSRKFEIRDDQKILFIKLGHGGEWEKDCILNNGTIRLGFNEANHSSCLNGDWDAIGKYYRDVERKTAMKATQFTNQIRQFYQEPEETIWFTFFAGHLWWCTAKAQVELLQDGTKIRRVIGKWRNQDISGSVISLDDLSGKLLQTRGFRGTICTPDAVEYLRRRLNAQKMPEVVRSLRAKDDLIESMIGVIQSLTPYDFEILVDLIFRQGGWQRTGIVGGTEKDVDLFLYSPVTKERIAIQVKSRSSVSEFRDYLQRFSSMSDFHRFFYIVHSGGDELTSVEMPQNVTLISGKGLSDLAVSAGLIDWIIKKAG